MTTVSPDKAGDFQGLDLTVGQSIQILLATALASINFLGSAAGFSIVMILRQFRPLLAGLTLAVMLTTLPGLVHSAADGAGLLETNEARRAYTNHLPDLTLSSLHRQAELLASWADAVERNGRPLPPTIMLGISRGLKATAADDVLLLGQALGAAAAELAQNIDQQDQLGQRRYEYTDLRVGEQTTVAQIYTVGADLGVDARLLLAKPWVVGRFQTSDPAAPNHISFSTTGSATIALISVPWQGIHGGRLRPELMPALQISAGSLAPGDQIRVVYHNLRLPMTASTQFDLPLYLSARAQGDFHFVPGEPLVVHGDTVAKLTANAPSLVASGEPFVVQVRLEDQFGNLAEGDLPSFDILVDGSLQGRLARSGPSSMTTAPITLIEAGRHAIEIRSSGGGIRGVTNPVIVRSDLVDTLSWVDLHRHSSASDGVQSHAEIVQQAEGSLDRLLVADHDNALTGTAWQQQSSSQKLKALHWTNPIDRGGHHLLVTRGEYDLHPAPAAVWPTLFALTSSLNSADSLLVALPEVPGDDRYADPRLSRLVEIVSGDTGFEWYGQRWAQRGSRVGFTGSAESHAWQAGAPAAAGVTAVWLKPGESLLGALQQGRTYVTSGARLLLEVTTNGAQPGQRVVNSARRVIRGQVFGTAGIRQIDLFKNGRIIDTVHYAGRARDQLLADRLTLAVTFESDSSPIGDQRDLARNGREWLGYITQTGASITAVTAPGFRNPVRQAVALNPGQANRVDFITWTRGLPSSLYLDFDLANQPQAQDKLEPESLASVDDQARRLKRDKASAVTFELNLSAGHEDVTVLPMTRVPSTTPAIRQQLSLADLLSGPVSRTFNVGGYQDTITYELISRDAATDQQFEFIDTRNPSAGDNYVIRVQQLDDHMAWSSPVWVGGFDL